MTQKINKAVFFDRVRQNPFPGKLTRAQVDGMESLFGAWSDFGDGDDRKLAYILATVFHETGQKMQPVREGFAKTDAEARRIVSGREYGEPETTYGHVYYGRGVVQLTWIENYRKMSEQVDVDLAEDPDAALDPEISNEIAITGMMKGMFTGFSLDEFFNDEEENPAQARRVVNHLDRADRIAGYYRDFKEALEEAIREAEEPTPAGVVSESPVAEKPKIREDRTLGGAVVQAIGGSGLSVITAVFGDVDNAYALAAFLLVFLGAALVFSGRFDLNWWTGE